MVRPIHPGPAPRRSTSMLGKIHMTKPVESDWKLISQNKQKYLDKLCERFNGEIILHLRSETKDYHKNYIQMWQLMRDNDKYIQAVFNEWKRSRFYNMVAGLMKLDLLGSDRDKLSVETKNIMIEIYGFTDDDFLVPF